MDNRLIRQTKLTTRKDVRDRLTEEEARDLFSWCKKKSEENGKQYKYSDEEIESEVRKIYESSSESLLDEDSRGVLLFDESATCW